MGQFDDVVIGEKNFAVYEALNEVLLITIEQAELAQQAENMSVLWSRLRVAAKALCCALEIYRDWHSEIIKEKERKSEQV